MDEEEKESLSKSSGNRKLRRFFLGLAVFCFFVILLGILQAWEIVNFSKQKTVPNSPYAIVLGATSYGDKPSPVFRERILHGVKLYKEGKVKKIIFTGKPGIPPQATVAKNFAISQGVPEADILTEAKSKNTLENLKNAAALLDPNFNGTILLISDPFHLKRATLMANDMGLKAFPAPALNSRFQSKWSQAKFLIRETLAYSYYRIRRLFRCPTCHPVETPPAED